MAKFALNGSNDTGDDETEDVVSCHDDAVLTGMWDFMGSLPADLPKIIVVEDLTKPVIYGSMWGEVGKSSKVLER